MDKKTMNTVLLVGGAALAVYLLTRPKTPTPFMPAPGVTYPAGYLQAGAVAPGNTTSSIIAASGTAAGNLISSLGDLFGEG